MDLFANSKVIRVGVSLGRESFFQNGKRHKIYARAKIGQGVTYIHSQEITWYKKLVGISKLFEKLFEEHRRTILVQRKRYSQKDEITKPKRHPRRKWEKCEKTKQTIDQSAGGKLRDLNAEESWALLEDLALYDNKSWNDPRDFSKSVKAIALPQDVQSTSDRRLIEIENQVQRLMEAHLAPTQPTQVNKITTSCEICSGPHDTQYFMEDLEQAFVEYASSRTDEAGGEMTNKIDNMLKAITGQIARALPSDTVKNRKLGTHPVSLQQPVVEIEPQQPEEPEPTLEDEFKDLHLNLLVLEVLAHAPIYNAIFDQYVESLELGKNGSAFVQGEIPAKMGDPGLFTLPCRLWDSKPFDTLADLGSCVNIIPLYLFKKLNIILLEENDHIFGLADGTKSYTVWIVRDIEVHI
ncbi:hypothetical protein Tco_0217437 [Tanacetum coccineum]